MRKSCGPSRAGGFGTPHLRAISAQSAAERKGLRHKGAALRQEAAAGCRPLPGRAMRQTAMRKPAFGSKPAERTHSTGAGLRVREASARRTYVRFPRGPQPSGRACDAKEQPSAPGRLRAADPSRDRKYLQQFADGGRRPVEPAGETCRYAAWAAANGTRCRANSFGQKPAEKLRRNEAGLRARRLRPIALKRGFTRPAPRISPLVGIARAFRFPYLCCRKKTIAP